MNGTSAKSSHLSQPVVKSVLVYRNGDPFFAGRRVVFHEKKVSSFDVFLKEVTGGVQAPFGAVRNIYTPRTGHRIRKLDQIQSGGNYVAGGQEAFKKLNYLDIGEIKKKPMEAITTEVRPVIHSKLNVSARFRRTPQEPCTILLYTLEGKLVENGEELENGQFYVAVGRDKFKKLPYTELLFDKSTMRRSYGQKASSLPPIVGSRKSKGSGNDRQSKSTIGSSDNSSPQPLKRKGKKEDANSEKPTKGKQNGKLKNSQVIPSSEEGIFKAGTERSETRGAVEIQEDEDTKVEIPVDQRTAEIVEEEDGDREKDAEQEDASGVNGEVEEGDREATDASSQAEEGTDPREEQGGTAGVNGGTNEENGEELDQVNNELQEASNEEIKLKGPANGQAEDDTDPQRPPRPEVKITSPQENDNNEQNKDILS
ncbi:doublecortin domain-containing protein 2 isoform X2 [Erinaceus europaeus]|uniref:Doublecortin domain-containing protein 2 isoform X2 n=1 Tax=Erinaceus europaeus TaxID=9365 RepID=A0ABM3X8Y5_ERIEU|nr:doublecortin domain-containing protein 2 isoform X2 [Erinaceus europaeus]